MIDDGKNKEDWDRFIVRHSGSFLHSWQWGELQKAMGRRIWRLAGADFQALIVEHKLPLAKSYLYCPRGPIGPCHDVDVFWSQAMALARREKAVFFKIEAIEQRFLPKHRVKAVKQLQPSQTVILDLHLSEDELLKQMHSKTRYNIRLAERRGVTVKEGSSKDLDVFLALLQQTSKRDAFHIHDSAYYHRLMQILGADTAKLFLAEHDGRVAAAQVCIFFGGAAVYAHGASDYAQRAVMAPYLLHWHALLEAKRLGLKRYDLWGIDERNWSSLTRFKRGFGGREVRYPETCDVVCRPVWHAAYRAARRLRRCG